MSNPIQVYTPEQVSKLLQLNKNTVYELINRGEIIAKRLGKVYSIPAASLSFVFTGLDDDLYQAEQADRQVLPQIRQALRQTRSQA